jgi:MoaA/NifB/PqqE/SkfB family radical SAM enzyme
MLDRVTQIELELTTRCNASCPMCVRNYYGGKTWPTLPIVDLDINVIKKSLSSIISSLKHVKLCGTYGDPCVYPDLIELVEWIKNNSDCEITINTNGSVRSVQWWKMLAQTLGSQGRVFFGIDGLEDTHHLHRVGTDYKKIIKNLTAFNQAGGKSVWSFLIFKHNQHQVGEAKKLSQELKCEHFAVKSTSRFLDKTHRLIDRLEVKNKKNQTIHWIHPTTDEEFINQGYEDINQLIKQYGSYENYLRLTTISCRSQKEKFVAISAEGYVMPCAFLLDRLYGHEAEQHTDHQKIIDLVNECGGFEKIDIHHTDFYAIINGDFFKKVEESWQSDRLERCANQCGNMSTLIKHANKHLSKVWAGDSDIKD